MQAKVFYSNLILLMLIFMSFIFVGCAEPEKTEEDKYTETTITLQEAKEIIIQSLVMDDIKSNRDIFNIWANVQAIGTIHHFDAVHNTDVTDITSDYNIKFDYQNSTYQEIIIEINNMPAGDAKVYSPNGQDLYLYLNDLPYKKTKFSEAMLIAEGPGYIPKFTDSDFEIYQDKVVKKGYKNNYNLILNLDMEKYLEYISSSLYPGDYEENVGTIPESYSALLTETDNEPAIEWLGEVNIEFTNNAISKITSNIRLQRDVDYYTEMFFTYSKYEGEITTPEWFDITEFEN